MNGWEVLAIWLAIGSPLVMCVIAGLVMAVCAPFALAWTGLEVLWRRYAPSARPNPAIPPDPLA